jgi:hypothetical protein
LTKVHVDTPHRPFDGLVNIGIGEDDVLSHLSAREPHILMYISFISSYRTLSTKLKRDLFQI